MRKAVTIVLALAALAGVAGLLIGISVARARRGIAIKAVSASNSESAADASLQDEEPAQTGDVPVIRFAKNPLPAPPFLANDLSGKIITTADWRGKVTILVFWATWCPPCREEIPDLIRLQNRYKDRLQVIGVSEDDDASPQEVAAFAKQAGINYSIVMGREQTISERYGGIPALPTTFLINSEGRVVQKHIGLRPPELYETEVRSLLGMPVHATVETFEDTGQIFLKNASLATTLPGVNFTGLTPDQKKAVLKRLNEETCTCGCKLTIAQCRLNDDTCPTSKKLAAGIIKEVLTGSKAPSAPANN
jgi:thiol-disulfide isomerase/thioredoxin